MVRNVQTASTEVHQELFRGCIRRIPQSAGGGNCLARSFHRQGAEAISLRDFCALKRSSNTSGVPGVHYLRTVRQPSGIWQAWVKLPDGGKIHRSFSVLRFGETEAFRLAVAARAELLQLVAERPYLRHPIAKRLDGATFASSGARLRFKICAAATEDSPALSASLS